MDIPMGATPATDDVFAERFKEARTVAKLSQDHIAGEMTRRGFAFHVSTVGKIERGERKASAAEAAALAEIVSQPLGILLGGDRLDELFARTRSAIDAADLASYQLASALMDLAAEADKVDHISDEHLAWLKHGLIGNNPIMLAAAGIPATAQIAAKRRGYDIESGYVERLISGIWRAADNVMGGPTPRG